VGWIYASVVFGCSQRLMPWSCIGASVRYGLASHEPPMAAPDRTGHHWAHRR